MHGLNPQKYKVGYCFSIIICDG